MTASVYLIGAGPGHPDLITVRGLRYLEAADVVLYDHLVHARLLNRARADAERIDVGLASPQPLEQEAICYLLVEKAREGKVVARLKWGDPFVFDTGGAEALFLHEQGVRFEVVPGILPGVGAASYAGVPLTYAGSGDTLTFVRGHEDEGRTAVSVDWGRLARLDGTVVCYGGPDQVPDMLDALLSHGRPAGDSAALIYDGTLPSQETKAGSLTELAEFVKHAGDRRAAVLVVGRVAALREHLRWFDTRPLFGKRVLVTRSADQAVELVERLESAGAEAIEAPMIWIAPPADYAPLDDACAKVRRFDWIVFSSANAVDAFLGRLLASPLDLRALGGARLCAVGPATSARLARHGLKTDVMPSEFRAEALVQALGGFGDVKGSKVLIPRADIGRDVAASALRDRGADVTDVVAYRTIATDPEREGGPDIYRMLLERRLDVVTFTSPSAVRNLVRVLGEEPSADLMRSVVVASIGPLTAEATAQHNIRTTVMPAEYTVPALVDAIVNHFAT